MIVENVKDIKPSVAHDQLIVRTLLKGKLEEFHGLWYGILKPKAHTAEHTHPYEEFYFILSGSGIMTVGNERQGVNRLDIIAIPGSANHGLVNNSEDDITYLCVAAPPTIEDRDLFKRGKGFMPDPDYKRIVDEGRIDTTVR